MTQPDPVVTVEVSRERVETALWVEVGGSCNVAVPAANLRAALDSQEGQGQVGDGTRSAALRAERDRVAEEAGEAECYSCGDPAAGTCPQSKRPCGHHCNCSWVHDHCHWCDKEFGETPAAADGEEGSDFENYEQSALATEIIDMLKVEEAEAKERLAAFDQRRAEEGIPASQYAFEPVGLIRDTRRRAFRDAILLVAEADTRRFILDRPTQPECPRCQRAGGRPMSAERDARLLERIKAADAVILVEDGGYSGFAWAKGPGEIPMSCKVSFGEDDDPPRTIRRVEVKAGWTLADWRKLDRSGLHKLDPAAPEPDGGEAS